MLKKAFFSCVSSCRRRITTSTRNPSQTSTRLTLRGGPSIPRKCLSPTIPVLPLCPFFAYPPARVSPLFCLLGGGNHVGDPEWKEGIVLCCDCKPHVLARNPGQTGGSLRDRTSYTRPGMDFLGSSTPRSDRSQSCAGVAVGCDTRYEELRLSR